MQLQAMLDVEAAIAGGTWKFSFVIACGWRHVAISFVLIPNESKKSVSLETDLIIGRNQHYLETNPEYHFSLQTKYEANLKMFQMERGVLE